MYSFKASDHAEANVLAEPYAKIEAIVAAAMTGRTNPKTSTCPKGLRPYNEDDIRKQAKLMIFSNARFMDKSTASFLGSCQFIIRGIMFGPSAHVEAKYRWHSTPYDPH